MLASCGCASLIEDLAYSAFGESSEEHRDRKAMERYREHWSTPGRTPYEVEIESRGTFRRVHGREPN